MLNIRNDFEKWLKEFNELRIKLMNDKNSVWSTTKTYDEGEKNLLNWFVQYKLIKYTWCLAFATWILAIATIFLVIFNK